MQRNAAKKFYPICKIDIKAVKEKNIKYIRDLLVTRADVNVPDFNGETPLQLAIINEDYEEAEKMVKILIAAGADVNGVNRIGNTALDYAIFFRNYQVIRYLKSLDNNPSSRNPTENGLSQLIRAVTALEAKMDVSDESGLGYELLSSAAMGSSVELMKQLLKRGVDVDMKLQNGMTALDFAIKNSRFDMIQLLVENGANVNYSNAGFTPLKMACYKCDKDIIEYLISKGADVNQLDLKGASPLMYTLQELQFSSEPIQVMKRAEIVKFLLSKWPNVNTIDSDGKNVLNVQSNIRIRKMIIEYIAKVDVLEQPLHGELLDTISKNKELKNYFYRCREELEMAKAKIHQKHPITYLELIVVDEKYIVGPARDRDLINILENIDFKMIFTVYGSSMRENVEKIKRMRLYDQVDQP